MPPNTGHPVWGVYPYEKTELRVFLVLGGWIFLMDLKWSIEIYLYLIALKLYKKYI